MQVSSPASLEGELEMIGRERIKAAANNLPGLNSLRHEQQSKEVQHLGRVLLDGIQHSFAAGVQRRKHEGFPHIARQSEDRCNATCGLFTTRAITTLNGGKGRILDAGRFFHRSVRQAATLPARRKLLLKLLYIIIHI